MFLVFKFLTYTCSLAVSGWTGFAAFQPLSDEGRKRLAKYSAGGVFLFVVAALGTVVLNVNELLGGAGLPRSSDALLYLSATSAGRSWVWRIGLTAALPLILLFPTRRFAWIVAYGIGAAALLPVATVSHAATAVEYTGVFIAVDWIHLLSIALWFGGLLALCMPGVVDAADRPGFTGILDRFSKTAMVVVPIAVATGAFEMQNTLEGANDLVTFTYGWALLAKHLFLLPVLVLAAYTMLAVKPRLKVLQTPELVRRARQNVAGEALLVLGMVASTAIFTQEVPPSHIGMEGPDQIKGLGFVFDPLFFLWIALGALAAFALVRAAFKGATWRVSSLSGAGFSLAVLLAVSSQVVTVDREVFRHSTDPAVIARGKELFATNCALCHGESGKGDGPLAIGLTPPPADLTQLHVYHHSDERVLSWITNGIPGTAMPPFGDVLSLEDRKAIVSFVRQLGVSEAREAN